MFKYIAIGLLVIIGVIIYQNSRIKNAYESVPILLPKAEVLTFMGQPNKVHSDMGAYKDYTDTLSNEDNHWVYFAFMLPEEFVLVIKDGFVVYKYHSVSP